MTALVGEYLRNIFYVLESKDALLPQSSFETLLSIIVYMRIKRKMADYLVATFLVTIYTNYIIPDSASFQSSYHYLL